MNHLTIAFTALAMTACASSSNIAPSPSTSENIQEASMALTQTISPLTTVTFESDVHTVSGTAVVGVNDKGAIQIDFSDDFNIDAGPDVFMFLVKDKYHRLGNGRPSESHLKIEQQIAVKYESVAGKMSYVIEGVSVEQLKEFGSLHFYCEAYGFIHWGGADLNW